MGKLGGSTRGAEHDSISVLSIRVLLLLDGFFIETFTTPLRRTVSCAATATHAHYNPSRRSVSRPCCSAD